MDIEQAKHIVKHEHDADDGLHSIFRMSDDVESEKIKTFISALKCLEEYYESKSEIDKDVAYQLFSMYRTLQGSIGHWKVSRPKGLDKDTCWKIIEGIINVFSS